MIIFYKENIDGPKDPGVITRKDREQARRMKPVTEARDLFPVGSRVKVSDGSGIASNKLATVVNRKEIRTDGRGVPTNIQGAYKPVDWSKEVAIKYDNGEYDTMFKNRLSVFKEESKKEKKEEPKKKALGRSLKTVMKQQKSEKPAKMKLESIDKDGISMDDFDSAVGEELESIRNGSEFHGYTFRDGKYFNDEGEEVDEEDVRQDIEESIMAGYDESRNIRMESEEFRVELGDIVIRKKEFPGLEVEESGAKIVSLSDGDIDFKIGTVSEDKDRIYLGYVVAFSEPIRMPEKQLKSYLKNALMNALKNEDVLRSDQTSDYAESVKEVVKVEDIVNQISEISGLVFLSSRLDPVTDSAMIGVDMAPPYSGLAREWKKFITSDKRFVLYVRDMNEFNYIFCAYGLRAEGDDINEFESDMKKISERAAGFDRSEMRIPHDGEKKMVFGAAERGNVVKNK